MHIVLLLYMLLDKDMLLVIGLELRLRLTLEITLLMLLDKLSRSATGVVDSLIMIIRVLWVN